MSKNIFISFLLVIILCLAIAMFLSNYCNLYLNISDFVSIVGLIVTAVGFFIGTYFAVLAVSAYSHVRDIDGIKKNLLAYETQINDVYSSTLGLAENIINLTAQMYTYQINLAYNTSYTLIADTHDHKRRINDLLRRRALLAIEYKYLKEDLRKNYIRELFETGLKEDLPKIESLLSDVSENGDVKDIAKKVYDIIQAKFD